MTPRCRGSRWRSPPPFPPPSSRPWDLSPRVAPSPFRPPQTWVLREPNATDEAYFPNKKVNFSLWLWSWVQLEVVFWKPSRDVGLSALDRALRARVCPCVSVCVWGSEWERERERGRDREGLRSLSVCVFELTPKQRFSPMLLAATRMYHHVTVQCSSSEPQSHRLTSRHRITSNCDLSAPVKDTLRTQLYMWDWCLFLCRFCVFPWYTRSIYVLICAWDILRAVPSNGNAEPGADHN